MKRESVFLIVFLIILATSISSALEVQRVEANETIYIRANGIVEGTDKISNVNSVIYTFTDNINDSIVVERDNIVVDGAGYTVQGTGAFDSKGIDSWRRSNVTIKNMTIEAFDYGIYLSGSSNNSVSGNNITNNDCGIWLGFSSNNRVSGNNITENTSEGILLFSSSNSSVSGNNMANNNYGILLQYSSNNSLSGNAFFNDDLVVQDSYGNVVVDNLVNGKPLVYLEDVSDYAIEDAGQVILVNCNRMRVENLNVSHTDIGVELWQTNNTKISGNNITNNSDSGINLCYSSNNSISGNNIVSNDRGILLSSSSNNSSVSGNNIANNDYGIGLFYCSNNSVSGNNITNNFNGFWINGGSNSSISGNNIVSNDYGIYVAYSSNNSVYHNNFGNNAQQVYSVDSTNVWDDDYPSGGNFWSDYSGADANNDGIGDTPYVIDANNTDRYPLMVPYVIPEFPSFLILPLFFMATLLAVIVYRRKRR